MPHDPSSLASQVPLVAELAPYLAGPAAAVLCLLLVLFGLWRASVSYLIPLATKAIDRHLAQIDRMIETHHEDSQKLAAMLAAQTIVLGDIKATLGK